MATYQIKWSDGRVDSGYTSYPAAKAVVEAELGVGCEIGHDGDLSDGGGRTLCWATEGDSINDDGSRAVASIVEVGIVSRSITAALPDDAVLVETMPDQHRGSHRPGGNWASYPHNG